MDELYTQHTGTLLNHMRKPLILYNGLSYEHTRMYFISQYIKASTYCLQHMLEGHASCKHKLCVCYTLDHTTTQTPCMVQTWNAACDVGTNDELVHPFREQIN